MRISSKRFISVSELNKEIFIDYERKLIEFKAYEYLQVFRSFCKC